jgi:hypothetical protein
MHPKLGTSAAESLAMLGTSDPRLGMPLFVVILFYSKILCSSGKFSAEISVSKFMFLSYLNANNEEPKHTRMGF